MHELRNAYKGANITAIDCDAGSSEVNQLNRLKLMLAVAKERGLEQAETEIARGKTMPAREGLASVREKYGL